MPMMPRSSAISDYVSMILRGIEKAETDPAQLRSLVYDIARISAHINLGKHVLEGDRRFGITEMKHQLTELEVAIKQVELFSRLEDLAIDVNDFQYIGAALNSIEEVRAIANGRRGGTVAISMQPQNKDLIVSEGSAAGSSYPSLRTEPLMPLGGDLFGNLRSPRVSSPIRDYPPAVRQILVALVVMIFLAVPANYMMGLGSTGSDEAFQQNALATSSAAGPSKEVGLVGSSPNTEMKPQRNFPIPTAYGIYAINGGKLHALNRLPIAAPDPRIAISALISEPSALTLPNGKLEFLVFRRELLAAAPETVSIRVVARIMRELKFGANGAAQSVNVEGQWAIRNSSFEFNVGPLDDHPEMIIIRPNTTAFALSPGRYALVFKGQAYDFTVAGPVADDVHCLERADALGGSVYSQCRAPL
jgi:hypothetical protein